MATILGSIMCNHRSLSYVLYYFAWCLFWLGNYKEAQAQPFAYKRYTIEEGLPSNEVYETYQDASGYLWFCTDHGVARFDGYEFEIFTTQHGLTHNTVFGVREDAQGRLWFLTFKGGLCYWDKGKIYQHPLNTQLSRIIQEHHPMSLYANGDTVLLANTNASTDLSWDINLYRILPQRIEKIPMLDAKVNTYNPKMAMYWPVSREQGKMSFIIGVKSYLFPNRGWDQQSEPVFQDKVVTFGQNLGQITYAGKDQWWMVHSACLLLFSRQGVLQKRMLDAPLGNIIHTLLDQEGHLWVATDKGLYYLDDPLKSTPQRFFDSLLITNIQQDRERNYWVSTNGAGVIFIPSIKIRIHQPQPQQAFVYIQEHDNSLWAVSNKGLLYVFDAPQNEWRAMPHRQKVEKLTSSQIAYKSPFLHFAGGQRVGKITPPHQPWLERKLPVKGMFYHDKESVWALATSVGAVLLRENGNLRYASWEQETRERMEFTCLRNDRELIFGGMEQAWLLRLDPDTLVPLSSIHPLFKTRVLDGMLTPQGHLVLATRGSGLLLWMNNGQVRQITEKHGLSTSLARCVWVEGDSLIWMGSNRGLDRIRWWPQYPDSLSIVHYSANHGLPSNNVEDIFVKNDTLWLVGAQGIVCFPLINRKDWDQQIPTVHIRKVSVNGHLIPIASDMHYLQPHENNLLIDFVGIRFRDAANVYYKYQLVGYDQAPTLTRNRAAQYTNLPPGQYTFKLWARGANGGWNSQPLELHFTVATPWLDRWWVRVLLFVLVAGLAAFIAWPYWRRSLLEREMLRSEQKALRAQLNPHFIFNALNSVMLFIRKNEKGPASTYLSRFSKLIRAVFENSKQELIPLEQELETLRLYLDLEFLRLGGQDDQYEIIQDPQIIASQWRVPPMLIQPFLENAIVHGLSPQEGARRLWLRLSLEGEQLRIEIQDNGIGLQAAQDIQKRRFVKHASSGMRNVQERLRVLRRYHRAPMSVLIEELHNEQGQSEGTRVVVHLSKL